MGISNAVVADAGALVERKVTELRYIFTSSNNPARAVHSA
jgi:hypothetical protein